MKILSRLRSSTFSILLAVGLTCVPSHGQTSPAAGSAGAPSTPPSGNYPGTGSSPQKGVVPPPLAPSGATPGSGNGGVTNTPPSGLTPGTGASPTPPGGPAAGPANTPPYTGNH